MGGSLIFYWVPGFDGVHTTGTRIRVCGVTKETNFIIRRINNGKKSFQSNFRDGGKIMSDRINQTQPASHALAILSLVLGILGLTPILPLVGSITAIVTGMIARREILAKPGEYSGESMARAGIILGWIGVALLLVVGCAALLFLVPFTVRTF
jgi:hypothetical protein